MSVAENLARVISNYPSKEIGEPTLRHAKMLIASTLASAAMGYGIESAQIVRKMAIERGGVAQSSLWFDASPDLPCAEAARSNTLAADAAASDDSDLRNMMHCGTPLVATSLALGQARGKSGREVLEAIIIGYEVAGLLSLSVPDFRKRNYHGSSVVLFGVAAAAGKSLDLDAEEMAHAISIAASSAAGLSMAADTSVMREYQGGQATFNGINAALYAEAGLRGEPRIFEMPGGFFSTFGGSKDAGEAAARRIETFGLDWGIDRYMAIKLVPGGHPYHALAEAAAEAVKTGAIDWRDITRITFARPDGRYMTGPAQPRDLIDMAHSPQYFLAAGAVDGGVTWKHATAAKILDADIHKVAALAEPGEPLENDPERFLLGAEVVVFTRDGRSQRSVVYAPRGATARGIDWTMLESKFSALMPISGLNAQTVGQLFEGIRNFENIADVGALVGMLKSTGED